MSSLDLYDGAYSRSSSRVYEEIRRDTYGLDLGQTGWMDEQEFRSFFPLLQLTPSSTVLEVGCGAGGCALYLAKTGASVTAIDINENGIRHARTLTQADLSA